MRGKEKELKINKGYRLENGMVLDADELHRISEYYHTAVLQQYIYENYIGYSVEECAAIAVSVLADIDDGCEENVSIEREVRERKRTYALYQLSDDDEQSQNAKFRSYSDNVSCGFPVVESKYRKVYEGELTDTESLEYLFILHNRDDRPDRKVAHSMSVSDVIVLERPALGYREAYYVDSTGFALIKDFFEDEEARKEERSYERIITRVRNIMSREGCDESTAIKLYRRVCLLINDGTLELNQYLENEGTDIEKFAFEYEDACFLIQMQEKGYTCRWVSTVTDEMASSVFVEDAGSSMKDIVYDVLIETYGYLRSRPIMLTAEELKEFEQSL